jgi:hypothetical protein
MCVRQTKCVKKKTHKKPNFRNTTTTKEHIKNNNKEEIL